MQSALGIGKQVSSTKNTLKNLESTRELKIFDTLTTKETNIITPRLPHEGEAGEKINTEKNTNQPLESYTTPRIGGEVS